MGKYVVDFNIFTNIEHLIRCKKLRVVLSNNQNPTSPIYGIDFFKREIIVDKGGNNFSIHSFDEILRLEEI